MCSSQRPPGRPHATSSRMDSEGQALTDQTKGRQQENIGILAQQLLRLKIGAPPLKEPKGSQGDVRNRRKEYTSTVYGSDRESHETTPSQTSNVTFSHVNISVKSKRMGDEKETTLDSSEVKSASNTGAVRHSEPVILETSIPSSHSNIKQKNGAVCAGSAADRNQLPPVANGANNETTSIDIPISVEEDLKKLSLHSPEILLERGPVSKSNLARSTNDEKPYSRPERARPQATTNSSERGINYNDDDETFIRALCEPQKAKFQECIPEIVFDKMNEKEPEKKPTNTRRKRDKTCTKATVPSPTESLDMAQIPNPPELTSTHDELSSTSVFGGPDHHPEVSVWPLALTNQASLSQVENQPPIFPSAPQKVLYQQHGIPPVSGRDTSLLTTSVLPCGQQHLFSSVPCRQGEQHQATSLAMNTSPLLGIAPHTSVFSDQCGFMTGPEQMQFNGCNSVKGMPIPQPVLVVGNGTNVAQETMIGREWKHPNCGGEQINYCLSVRNVTNDGGYNASVPTADYLPYGTENGGQQQNYSVGGSHGQQQNFSVGGSHGQQQNYSAGGSHGQQQNFSAGGSHGQQQNFSVGGSHGQQQNFSVGGSHGQQQNFSAGGSHGQQQNFSVGGSHGQQQNFSVGGSHGQQQTFNVGGSHGQQQTFNVGGSHGQQQNYSVGGNPGQLIPAGQVGGTMTNGGQHMHVGLVGGTIANGEQHMASGQFGGTMANGGQHMHAGLMGGTMANGEQHMTSGQIGGPMENGGQRLSVGQMGGTMTNGGHRTRTQQMANGLHRMSADLTGGTLLNGNLQMPADHMGSAMVNGGQNMMAGYICGTTVNNCQHMPADQVRGTMVNGTSSTIVSGGQTIPAGQIDCIMANAGLQINSQRMASSRVSGPLALLVALGKQFQNVPIQNGRRHRKLLPKQKK